MVMNALKCDPASCFVMKTFAFAHTFTFTNDNCLEAGDCDCNHRLKIFIFCRQHPAGLTFWLFSWDFPISDQHTGEPAGD